MARVAVERRARIRGVRRSIGDGVIERWGAEMRWTDTNKSEELLL